MKLIMAHFGKGIIAGIVFFLLFGMFYSIIFGGTLGNFMATFSNSIC